MPISVPTDLSGALAAQYELRGVLGRGGMATVYLAHDRKHHREVALKVLRPEIAASLGAQRFLTEIQIAARMVHPHILTLHDSGEAEGFVYYVMPYIEGGSLRQRLEGQPPMAVDRALAIATPVADALSYAHRLGVLHRDIKPENILFAQSHPIVADFGIAKALSSASGPNLTRTGISLGTPGYMSPEQAAGFTDVDERTDVYSLAVIVYEMIVGQIPGRWPSEDAVHAGRFLEAPESHRSRLAVAGGVVEGALVRGLAVRPDFRTASPLLLVDEMRGTVAPKNRRRYRPEEIDEIVRRASELEASNPTQGAMTMGGVEKLASDVGIPLEHVRSVVASMTPRADNLVTPHEPPKMNRFLRAPTRLFYERVVEGELDDRDFPLLVEETRRVMENVGQVSQLGRSFSWIMMRTGSGPRRDLEVSVSVRGGRTRITVQENLSQLVGATYGGIVGGVGAGGMGPLIPLVLDALNAAPMALAVAIPAWLLSVASLARHLYFRSATKRQKTLELLADRLEALVRELVTPRIGG